MSAPSMPFEIDRRGVLMIAAGAAMTPLIPADAKAAATGETTLGLGRDQPFDLGWRFLRGAADGAEAPTWDDAAWRTVDLPHDWSVEDVPGGKAPRQLGPFSKDAKGGTATGYTEGGEGWYRRHFRLAALPVDARVEIAFDGVANLSDVWLNGHKLGAHVHSYTPFAYDLTPHLLRDGDNVLAVRVRNEGLNSRWYSGSGIYRQVKITVLPGTAGIARWGVGAWTRRITDDQALIDVTTRLDNVDPTLTLVTRLRTAQGRVAAEASGPAAGEVKQTLDVQSAHLWSPDTPYLYTLETELRRGRKVLDKMVQPFGVRIITMDAASGMKINGAPFKMRGGCVHHDNGLLGAVAFADADERRVRLLKARGFNALRSSHNPTSATLRTACDKLGMLLIEESFDMWHVEKLKDDYTQYIRQDWQNALAAMVLSARNSPSVILWSVGNEIPYRSTPEGVEWCWKFANEVRRLDPTRPVTAALNGVLGNPVIASEKAARSGFAGKPDEASTVFLDVAGYNYKLEDIESDHAKYPERIIYASETFPVDAYGYQALSEKAPYFLGEFVWTAMDYLGEAGLGATAQVKQSIPFYLASWPWIGAWCGDIDLIGVQKPQSLVRDVIWGLSPLEMLVQRPVADGMKELIAPWGWRDELPSWTWPDAAGKSLTVRLYTAGDRVELLLNGKSVGVKDLTLADKMVIEFTVPYAPGTLEAVAWKQGRQIARKRLDTVSAATHLRLTPEHLVGRADRQGLSYVALDVLDAQGRVIPEAELPVRLHVEGPAQLVGFGSANPKAVGSFQSNDARTFRGQTLAILRSTGAKGAVRLQASSEGLQGHATTIKLA